MESCSHRKAPIVISEKFSKGECSQNDNERNHMKIVSYTSAIGSQIYAQVCIHPNIAFVVDMLVNT